MRKAEYIVGLLYEEIRSSRDGRRKGKMEEKRKRRRTETEEEEGAEEEEGEKESWKEKMIERERDHRCPERKK